MEDTPSEASLLRGSSLVRVAILCSLLCASLTTIAGQETSSQSERPPQQVNQPTNEVPEDEPNPAELEDDGADSSDEQARNEAAAANPCAVRTNGDEERLDQFRREVFESVCESAAWFDGFFGSQRFDEEARLTHGRIGAQLVWDEHEGIEADGDLKVRVDFPNLDHRLNAFLGREDADDFLAGAEDNLDFLPTFFEREGGQEWLLGLGYRPVGDDRSSLDFDVGIDVDFPVDPFARARYRRYWLLGDDFLLRARQTVYWTNQKDLGTGTRIDLERPIGSRTLTRWATSASHDSETEGVNWDTGITVFHGFSPDRAISWFVGIDGETGREVPLESYGTRFTYRQRMLREWFFGELITGVTWPRDTLEEDRELAFHIGFGFEIQFSGEDLGLGR